jgi:hypothetical protein
MRISQYYRIMQKHLRKQTENKSFRNCIFFLKKLQFENAENLSFQIAGNSFFFKRRILKVNMLF